MKPSILFILLHTFLSCLIHIDGNAQDNQFQILNNSKDTLFGSQPTHLKEVVVSKMIQRNLFNAIANIDLNTKPVKNSQEILRLVPGLFIAQHAGGGKAEQLFLRGFDSDHGTDILVTVDGIPVNMVSHSHGQGYADAHFIIPETIGGLEFGTGPYYTQQGNFNTAGYIGMKTLNHLAESRIQIEAGQFNTKRILGMFNLSQNTAKQNAYIATEALYTNGPTVSPQQFSRYNLFAKYNRQLNDLHSITASLSAFSSDWYASGQIPERAVRAGIIDRFGSIDNTEGGNTSRYNALIKLNSTLRKNLVWENQLYYSKYIFNLFSNFTFFLNDPVNGDGIQQAENRDLYGFNSTLSVKSKWGEWNIKSIYGLGIRYDQSNNNGLSNTAQRRFISANTLGNIKETNSFAFVEYQTIKGKWAMDLGFRADYFNFNYQDLLMSNQLASQQKAILSPKFNIQYSINKQTRFYFKSGKGFHSNDTRVVVANLGREILPAAYGADLGIILKPSSKVLLNLAAWYLYLNQEFVYVGDAGVVEPSGKSRRQGFDVMARYQINDQIYSQVNYNITRPRALGEPKGANFIPLAPTATSTGGIFYKKDIGFSGGISYRYIQNRPANEDNSIIAKGYFITDAAVQYRFSKLEVGLMVENLFNTDWNEAQFATESKLISETTSTTELHFTPGVPFFAKLKIAVLF